MHSAGQLAWAIAEETAEGWIGMRSTPHRCLAGITVVDPARVRLPRRRRPGPVYPGLLPGVPAALIVHASGVTRIFTDCGYNYTRSAYHAFFRAPAF